MNQALWEIPAPITPGEHLAIVLTGGCVSGHTASLKAAEGREMWDGYPNAKIMADVVNICLGLVEQYGYPQEGGATPEAWEWVVYEEAAKIDGGTECANYCQKYFQDFLAAQEESGQDAPNLSEEVGR